jgi:hypothetical protein
MDEKDLPQSFHDLIEPSSIPFRFNAPGWWVLAVVMVLVLLASAVLIVRHYRKNAYRKKAIHYLEQIELTTMANTGYPGIAYQTAMLMKRVAIAKYGRKVAGLSGESWLSWLNDKTRRRHRHPFNEDDGKIISDAIYSNETINADQVNHFVRKAKDWIKYHHAI